MARKLYLDQCMVSDIANQGGRPWQETRGGQAIFSAQRRGTIKTWASPMHVLETFLCADFDERHRVTDTPKLDLRQAIASTHLHLAEAERMAPAYEFVLAEHFMKTLDEVAPGAVRSWAPFERLKLQNQQVYLGLLGLLAAYRGLDRSDAVAEMARGKVTSRLLHSRFARDPRAFMDDIVAAAREFRVTRDDVFAEYDRRSLSDLTKEIEENAAAVGRLDGGMVQRLQRDKDLVAKSYGATEIGECLAAVFSDPLFLVLSFDIARVRDNWGRIVGRPDARPPEFLAAADEEACATDHELVVKTLELLFRTVASERLLLPRLVHKVVLGELELALRQGEIPSGGLGFDCEHAAMLARVDVFGTVDGRFATLAKRAAAELAAAGHQVDVVVGTDELVRYLGGL